MIHLVALDMTKAFGLVKHSILIILIMESSLPSYVKRLLVNYIQGMQTYVEFRVFQIQVQESET